MNIGSIQTTNYTAWRKSNVNSKDTDAVSNQGVTGNFELHGVLEELKEEGYVSVGAWVDARTGTSISVYKTPDFDENNPVYLMKKWDVNGNVTEKEVNMYNIYPKACDVYQIIDLQSRINMLR